VITTTNIIFSHFRKTFIPVQTTWMPLRSKKISDGEKRRIKKGKQWM
jgi:hypothetical protein